MKKIGYIGIEVTTNFKCSLCGKHFSGEETKMKRKFIIHMFCKHPKPTFAALWKDIKRIIKRSK